MLVWEFTKRNIPNNDKIEESHIYTTLPLCQYAIIGNLQIYTILLLSQSIAHDLVEPYSKVLFLLISLVLISIRIC